MPYIRGPASAILLRAIRSGTSGHHSRTQLRKQAENRSGSMRFMSVRSQSAQGSPKWNALKRRRNERWASPQVDDVVIVIVGGDGAAHDQEQHLRQRVGDAPSLAWVRHGAEVVQQAAW